MVRRKHAQRSVFEVLLPDGDKRWDPALRRIDEVLEDEELVDLVADALGRRRLGSRRKGRPGTPAEVVLRMLVRKHRYDWSFDESEREVRGSLVYRAFCRIDCERVPDAKTLIRLSHLLGADVLKKVLARLVDLARERKVVRGWKLRVDTTVVETNVHYPTDSSLLSDGVRVLTRTLKELKEEVGEGVGEIRDRSRALAHRVFELAQRSRKLVKIQEAEGQFITDYEVCPTRVADQDLWVPSLKKHRDLFGRPPRTAVADAGFASWGNAVRATELGVKQVVLPGSSKRMKERS